MSNMGYIVEVRKKYAIIMSEDSGFVRIKTKPGMIGGILIEYTNDQIIENKMRPVVWLASSAVAAAVILLTFLFSANQIFYQSKAYMYVDIDINPSLELSIDKNGIIMKANSLNSDGKNLIDKIMLKGMNLKEGLIVLVKKSIEDGFINTDKENSVVISTCINPNLEDTDLENENIDNILGLLSQMDLKDYNITKKIINVTSKDRRLAIENDLSMGRYELYKDAQKYKLDLSLLQVKNSSVNDLLSKIYKPKDKTAGLVKPNTPGPGSLSTTPFNKEMQENTNTPKSSATPASSATPKIISTPIKAKVTAKAEIHENTMTPIVQTTTTPLHIPTPTGKGHSLKFNGTGLRGEYYDNMDLTDLKTVQIDSYMDFNWSIYPPAGIQNDEVFSVRWKGEIMPFYSEKYTFYITRDNGVRLWIDNKLIIDQWDDKCFLTNTASIELEAGKRYDIKMEYYNNTGLSYVKLEWSSLRTQRMVVPQVCLYP